MSLFGSLRTSYTPPAVPASRLPTVSDAPSDDGKGNGGNEFLSLIDGGATSPDGSSTGNPSVYSTLSPEAAYRVSLIGSLLDGGNGGGAGGDIADDITVDNPIVEATSDLEAGATAGYDASGSEEVTNDLQSTAADNTLPKVDDGNDDEVENPIAEVGGVTNALPKMDAPPA